MRRRPNTLVAGLLAASLFAAQASRAWCGRPRHDLAPAAAAAGDSQLSALLAVRCHSQGHAPGDASSVPTRPSRPSQDGDCCRCVLTGCDATAGLSLPAFAFHAWQGTAATALGLGERTVHAGPIRGRLPFATAPPAE